MSESTNIRSFLFYQSFSTFSTFFTTWRAFLAANPPIDTWSSVPALVERESTEAGWHKVLFSDTGKWRKCQELRRIEGSYHTIKEKEMVKEGRDVSFILVLVGFYIPIHNGTKLSVRPFSLSTYFSSLRPCLICICFFIEYVCLFTGGHEGSTNENVKYFWSRKFNIKTELSHFWKALQN